MSVRRLTGLLLASSFVLTFAGAASARRPPALVGAQERVDRIAATCPKAPGTSGYRDMLARVEASSATPRAAVARLASSRKMGDHFVIVCAGVEIHQGPGYRDFPVRIPRESAGPHIARAPQVIGRR